MSLIIPGNQDTTGNQIMVPGGAGADAFGRLRASEPHYLFGAKFDQTAQDHLFTTSTSGAGSITYNSTTKAVELKVTTANGDVAIRQSKIYVPYQPGRSQLCMFSGVMGLAQANTTKRIGYFDNNNGFFFEQAGTTKRVVLRKAGAADVTKDQSNWNLDKLDGTGSSGITVDWTKIQVFVIDFTWLGAGRIRYGFLFDTGIVYCHETAISNSATGVSIALANQPLRYEIRNTGTAASATQLDMICCACTSEGGNDPSGFYFSADNGITVKSIGTTLEPILSLRLKSANPRAFTVLQDLNILITAASSYRWSVLLNPTLTGASFTAVNTNSYMEYDVAATSLSGGTQLLSGYTSQDVRAVHTMLEHLQKGILASDFAGTTMDILTIAAQVTSGATRGFLASATWLELP